MAYNVRGAQSGMMRRGRRRRRAGAKIGVGRASARRFGARASAVRSSARKTPIGGRQRTRRSGGVGPRSARYGIQQSGRGRFAARSRGVSKINPGSTRQKNVVNADSPVTPIGPTTHVTNIDKNKGFGSGTGLG